jgi:hypothetical protein
MYEGWYKSNTYNFSENVIAIIMKFTQMIYTSFAVMTLIFHKASVTFNAPVPTLIKILYTNVVKFPTSTSEHITKTSFQFTVISKIM